MRYSLGRRERAHLAIDVVHRLGVHGRHDEAAEGGADRLDERDEVLVARDDSRAVVRGRDAVDDRPASVLGERAVQPVGHDLGYLEDGRLGPSSGRGLARSDVWCGVRGRDSSACTSAPAAGDASQIVSPTATSDACLSAFAGPAGSL